MAGLMEKRGLTQIRLKDTVKMTLDKVKVLIVRFSIEQRLVEEGSSWGQGEISKRAWTARKYSRSAVECLTKAEIKKKHQRTFHYEVSMDDCAMRIAIICK